MPPTGEDVKYEDFVKNEDSKLHILLHLVKWEAIIAG